MSKSKRTNNTYEKQNITKSRGGKKKIFEMNSPVILLSANQLYEPKIANYNFSKNRKNRTMKGGNNSDIVGGDMAEQLKQVNELQESTKSLMNSINPTIPSTIITNDAPKITTQYGGNKNNGIGGGIITNIAVPAVLLTANNYYKRRRTNKKRITRNRKTFTLNGRYKKG